MQAPEELSNSNIPQQKSVVGELLLGNQLELLEILRV